MPTPNVIYKGPDGYTVIAGSVKNYGQLLALTAAETDTAALKICLENVSTRALGVSPFTTLLLKRTQVGVNDGVSFAYTAVDPDGTLSKPWGLNVDALGFLDGAPLAELVGTASGVWGGGGTGEYGTVVTALNATGETPPSEEKIFVVAAAAEEWRITWGRVPSATGYKVYRTAKDAAGIYDTPSLIATIGNGDTTSYVHLGSAPSSGAPPVANTTGGAGPNYGTAPSVASHTSADKTIATAPTGLAVGQQWFFYLMIKLPAGTSTVGNNRSLLLLPTEV
jgi:hypothetical protein